MSKTVIDIINFLLKAAEILQQSENTTMQFI